MSPLIRPLATFYPHSGEKVTGSFPLRVVGEVLCAAGAVEGEDLRRQAIEQISIVCHQHQRAGKLQERFFQDIERRDIEIVRRLVEHQQIGGLQD